MSISVMAMGRMKEKPYRQMADEYLKRLSRYGKFEEIELPDLPEPANTSEAIERQIRDKEGEMMLSRLKPSDYVIALTIPGKMHDSPGLSRHLDELLTHGESSICIRYRRFTGAGGCRHPPRERGNVDEQNDVPASAGARDAAGTAVSCHENPRRREVS